MQARRGFLLGGGYDKLAEKLTSVIKKIPFDKESVNILDLGCGEGYFTSFLANNISDSYNICGLDISKVAVRYAAKRYKNIEFCVASAFDIPLEDKSLDIIIRNYAPSLDSELNRVISDKGYFITITPGPRHLYQLREIIYKDVIEHPSQNPAPENFSKVSIDNLSYKLLIEDSLQLTHLVGMTPFAWKFSKEKIDNLLLLKKWEIECDFNIEVYRKN